MHKMEISEIQRDEFSMPVNYRNVREVMIGRLDVEMWEYGEIMRQLLVLNGLSPNLIPILDISNPIDTTLETKFIFDSGD